MESEGSVLCSQYPAIDPILSHMNSDHSLTPTFLENQFYYYSPIYSQIVLSLQGVRRATFTAHPILLM